MLKLLFRQKRRKLALTQDTFESQALDFMDEYGFEPSVENLRLFGSFIQHSSENDDTFDPDLMARRIRKAHANALAFYMMHPNKKPKPPEEMAASDEQQEG